MPQTTATCILCGRSAPRSEMFGADPDLVCEACAAAVRERLAPRRGASVRWRPPVVTALAVGVAAVLFVLVHLLRNETSLAVALRLVADPAAIRDGEVWRLITSAFLHIGPLFRASMGMGILHVFFNGWWIWGLGRGIEGAWGHLSFLGLLLGSAAAASLVSHVAGEPGVGLSGVVYALAGFLFVWRRSHPVAAALMNPRTVQILAIWFVISIVLTVSDRMSIGNWAHGGGLAWGLLAGLCWRTRLRRLAVAALLVATAALVAVAPSLPVL